MPGLTAFDRRLDPASPAPLAVAFSGGGDSLALLKQALAWGRAHGRPVLALTVDHRLQPASAAWTADCAAKAARLGAGFRALSWEGDKPARGLPAAARAARHALLADAARQAGASVILMGHTADDVLEAAAMRAAGSTVPDPREWSPSPAWPQGRGVFILRPLLGVRRQALREQLTAEGETWIEDPANADLTYARARARAAFSSPAGVSPPPQPLAAGGRGFAERAGVLTAPRHALTAAQAAAACVCAAGTCRPPRGDRLARLMERLQGAEPFTATLAGARIEAGAEEVRFMREAGREGLPSLALSPHVPAVWDDRYEITAQRAVTVLPLKGLIARLPRAERAALRAVPAAARPTLPALVDAAGAVSCPILAKAPAARCVPLALERLSAALGAVRAEPPANAPVAPALRASYIG